MRCTLSPPHGAGLREGGTLGSRSGVTTPAPVPRRRTRVACAHLVPGRRPPRKTRNQVVRVFFVGAAAGPAAKEVSRPRERAHDPNAVLAPHPERHHHHPSGGGLRVRLPPVARPATVAAVLILPIGAAATLDRRPVNTLIPSRPFC